MAYRPYMRSHMTPLDPGRERDDQDPYGELGDDPALAAASAFPGARGRMAALLPERNPELKQRWLTAENQALDRSTEPEYGVAEGVRDFAPMAIGSLLDILVNKGKGLGTLAAGGMQALSSESTRRDAARAQAAKEALSIRGEREQGGDRRTNAYHAFLRGEELLGKLNKDQLSPEERAQKTQAEIDEIKQHARLYGAEADEKAAWPGGSLLLKMLESDDRNVRDKALLELKRMELEERKRQNDLKQQQLEQKGREETETKANAARTRNIQNFNRAGKDVLAQAQVLNGIEPLLIKYGSQDRPGVGPLDARTPTWLAPLMNQNTEDAIKFRQAQQTLFGWAQHEITGAASPQQERDFNQVAQGLNPGATEAEVTGGLNNARRILRAKIRGLAAADEEAAKEVLRENGLYDFVYGAEIEYGKSPKRSAGGGDTGPILYNPGGQPAPAPAQPSPQDLPTRAPQPNAAPGDQPEPAPATGTSAQPEPVDKNLQARMKKLMRRIPDNVRDSALGGVAPLSMPERFKALRKIYGTAEDYDMKDDADRALWMAEHGTLGAAETDIERERRQQQIMRNNPGVRVRSGGKR